jgi:hypothetical protein
MTSLLVLHEYDRYVSLLDAQLATPSDETSETGGAVEVRFQMTQTTCPRTAWVWCKSQYEAAKILSAEAKPSARVRNAVHRMAYEGDWSRARRRDKWVVRVANDSRPPARRGWAVVRKHAKQLPLLEFWLKETYKPTSIGHKRRREEYEKDMGQ